MTGHKDALLEGKGKPKLLDHCVCAPIGQSVIRRQT
jgi:hypothetical protein